ncbi:hypothetical protein N7488_002828 [Penicillium malachiteum]|nr:hypothetical protein N7488_002828 [Penicillium malachiteum]
MNIHYLPGTGTDILRRIEEWAFSSEEKCIFWLNETADTRKSISRTVARSFGSRNALGASFFFKRREEDRPRALRLFPKIARRLLTSIRPLLPCIEQAVQNDPAIATKAIKDQFDKLLRCSVPILVIVIDALDEFDGDNDLRLFLTSRPELVIRLGFSKIPTDDHQDLILHNIPRELINHDISLFLTPRISELEEELEPSLPLPEDWLGETNLQRLVAISFPLFIIQVAATICRMFKDPSWDPIDSLTEILLRGNTSNIRGVDPSSSTKASDSRFQH